MEVAPFQLGALEEMVKGTRSNVSELRSSGFQEWPGTATPEWPWPGF